MIKEKAARLKCTLQPDRSPFLSHLQHQMPLDGLLDLLGLDTDIPLGHGGGGVLQELLYQGDVVPAVLVDFRGVELAEAVGADPRIAQVVTD